ncbi:heme-binding protein 1-like [Spea bombifrons]|uniref:heme-binding protein 1-like n=1 Tax=Spea bombifrons TaxID=233779 RepID=UPI00234913C9|nr:heme-binding protein 1-like [Spea bombifrons]
MMGDKSLIVLCLLCIYGCSVTVEQRAYGGHQNPAICRSTKCPKYKVLKKYEGFEYRLYEPSNWVMTSLSDNNDITCADRLSKYMDGFNEQGIKIEMTSPVVIAFSTENASKDVVLFFLPPEVGCPFPLDNTVHCKKIPAVPVYVKSFEGNHGVRYFADQATALARELGALKKPFVGSFFGCNRYNNDHHSNSFHNEVWLLGSEPLDE